MKIAALQKENRALQQALTQANEKESQATEQLAQIKLRLEALGKNLLDGGDDRLVQAAADLQVSQERVQLLEQSVTKLIAAVQDYIKLSVVSEPKSRLFLETSLRELDVSLGLRQKPLPDIRAGSLQKANVVSIDQETNMIVLNLGSNQGAKIGMTFQLSRGLNPCGKAIVADVRKEICGAFIVTSDETKEQPHTGDIATLLTE